MLKRMPTEHACDMNMESMVRLYTKGDDQLKTGAGAGKSRIPMLSE